MEQHWLSHGWPRSPTLCRVRGRADRKGACCGAEGPASGDSRTDGLGGRALRSGAGSPESRDPGEGARPIWALPPAVEKTTRQARLQLAREGFTSQGQRLKKGFKQENVVRGSVYADREPKPPQQHLKPKRKDNWAANGSGSVFSVLSTGCHGFQVAGNSHTMRTSERGRRCGFEGWRALQTYSRRKLRRSSGTSGPRSPTSGSV